MSSKKLSNDRVLTKLGKSSIYIYLTHNYITVLLRVIYIKLGVHIPDILYIFGCLAATLLICSLIQWIVEKWDGFDLFFRPVRVFKKHSRAAG